MIMPIVDEKDFLSKPDSDSFTSKEARHTGVGQVVSEEVFLGTTRSAMREKPKGAHLSFKPTGEALTPEQRAVEGAAVREGIRDFLEYGGTTVGGVVGAPFTLQTGGAAPVLLAGTGGAFGKTLADILFGEEVSAPKEVLLEDIPRFGTEYAAGETLLPAAKIAFKGSKRIAKPLLDSIPGSKSLSSLSTSTIRKEVAKKIKPITDRVAKQTQRIARRTKTTLRRGQITNDQDALNMERDLLIDKDSLMSRLEKERRDENIINLQKYYENKVKTGASSVEDVEKLIEKEKSILEASIKNTEDVISKIKTDIETGLSPSVTGKQMYRKLIENFDKADESVKKLYSKVPNVKNIDASEIDDVLKTMQEEFKHTDPSIYPMNIIRQLKETIAIDPSIDDLLAGRILKKKTTDLETLTKYDKWVNRLIGEARNGIIDRSYERTLGRLKSVINSAMDNVEEGYSVLAVNAYRAARNEAKKFADTFYNGSVGEILSRGRANSGLKYHYSEMASKFLTKGATKTEIADDLINAIGNEESRALMLETAYFDVFEELTKKGWTNKNLKIWLNKYKHSLEKFGIGNAFDDLGSLLKGFEAKSRDLANLESSALGKILGRDTDKAMLSIYSGSAIRESEKVTRNIVLKLKASGNKAALMGYKNSFADFLKKEVERNLETLTGPNKVYINAMKAVRAKYGGVIKELYKDEPRKIVAMNDIQKIMEVSSREGEKLISGSDTASNLVGLARRIGRKLTVASDIIKYFSNLSEKKQNLLFTEATFNPEIADTLLMGLEGKVNKKVVELKLNHYFSRLLVHEYLDSKEDKSGNE